MTRWWRRRAAGEDQGAGARPPRYRQEQEGGQEHRERTDGQPPPGPNAQDPAGGSGNARRPAGGHITITEVTEGRPEQEIARVELSAEQIHTMRARSAIDTLGPEHPDALTAMRELAQVLGSIPGRGEEAVELYQHVVRTQWSTRRPP